MATDAQQTTLSIGSDLVGEITSWNFSGLEVTIRDRTTLASVIKEKGAGLTDPGSWTFDLFVTPSDEGQREAWAAATAPSKTVKSFTLALVGALPDFTFQGYVTNFAITGERDTDITASITITSTTLPSFYPAPV